MIIMTISSNVFNEFSELFRIIPGILTINAYIFKFHILISLLEVGYYTLHGLHVTLKNLHHYHIF